MIDLHSIAIAPDGTHHLVEDRPLYVRRFRSVLKYHPPGLAPAEDAEGAFHIDLDGRAAYEARFVRTFGFYEGRAAVSGSDGWYHIRPTGEPVYEERYSWCGNYQGGRCTVRARAGLYYHVEPSGLEAYTSRWRYAGDFRDGIAVVQAEDGLSSHIDRGGALVHSRWFRDLDVFHKGFARARDDGGWMHVDRLGRPVYAARFAAVEPFYNGQARVERFDGGLEVIDESGETLLILRAPSAQRQTFEVDSADLPASLMQSLARIPRDAPRVLFIRHADRDPIPTGSWGNDIPLNAAGERRARSLQVALAREPRWAISSPIDRCRQTAAFATGSVPGQVTTHKLLGAPGPFVVDKGLGRIAFDSLGTPGVVLRLIETKPLDGFRSAAEGTRLITTWVRALLDERRGSGVLVSHDAIVAPVVARIFGASFESRWLEFLEGIVFTVSASGELVAHWEGRSVEVGPC